MSDDTRKGVLERAEDLVVSKLEALNEDLESMNDELGRTPAGRAVYKVGIAVGVLAVVVTLLLPGGAFTTPLLVLAVVEIVGCLYVLTKYEPASPVDE